MASASKLLLAKSSFGCSRRRREQSARRNFRSLGVCTSCRAIIPAAVTPVNNSAFRNFYNCVYIRARHIALLSAANFYLGARQAKKFEKSLRHQAWVLQFAAAGVHIQCNSEKLMESRLTMRDLRAVTRSYLHTMLYVCTLSLIWSARRTYTISSKKREQSSSSKRLCEAIGRFLAFSMGRACEYKLWILSNRVTNWKFSRGELIFFMYSPIKEIICSTNNFQTNLKSNAF